LRAKCELTKPYFNTYLIDILKKEVLLTKESDGELEEQSVSPRVKNLIYKPIFCYTFFLLSYLNMKMTYNNQNLSIFSKSPSDISTIEKVKS
jgi:hypothetical protein